MLIKKQKDEIGILRKVIERQNKDAERSRQDKNRLKDEINSLRFKYETHTEVTQDSNSNAVPGDFITPGRP